MGVHFLSQYRNPLAYPAGYAPGFDPGHPLANRCVFSCVAMSGGLVRVDRPSSPTIVGSAVAGVDGIAGPAAHFTNSTDAITFTGLPTVSTSSATLSCIFTVIGLNSGFFFTCNTISAGPTAHFFSNKISWKASGNTNNPVGFTVVAGHSYFFSGSMQTIGTAQNLFWAMRDLTTGEIQSGTSSVTSAITSGAGTWTIGFRSGANNAKISALAVSTGIFSPAVHAQTAADPWSFWYPNPGDNWIAAQAAAGLGRFSWFVDA